LGTQITYLLSFLTILIQYTILLQLQEQLFEDVILTFCPKIESLNLQESELANYKTIIEELGISKSHREIFNYTKLFTELHSNIKNFQDFRSQIHINQHSFQDEIHYCVH